MIFLAARSGRNGLMPFVGTVLLVLLGMAFGQMPLLSAIEQLDGLDDIDENKHFLLLLLGFVGGFVALLFAVLALHRRSPRTLVTAAAKVDWKRLASGFFLWLSLVAVGEVALYLLSPAGYVMQFNWQEFWPLLLISLLVLPIQTSLEELFFRGYLLQQMGLLLNHKVLPLLITSVLFGLMHIANPEVTKFGLIPMMFYYISFGLLLGLCTVLDGRLEIALGMHAANNFFGATILSFSGSALQTPSVFYTDHLHLTAMLMAYLILALLFFLFFARKYRWRLSALSAKVLPQDDQT